VEHPGARTTGGYLVHGVRMTRIVEDLERLPTIAHESGEDDP
jgi:hypothetical protein